MDWIVTKLYVCSENRPIKIDNVADHSQYFPKEFIHKIWNTKQLNASNEAYKSHYLVYGWGLHVCVNVDSIGRGLIIEQVTWQKVTIYSEMAYLLNHFIIY